MTDLFGAVDTVGARMLPKKLARSEWSDAANNIQVGATYTLTSANPSVSYNALNVTT